MQRDCITSTMLRLSARPVLSSFSAWQSPAQAAVRYLAAARTAGEANEEELQAARTWLDRLHAETIPKSIGELSFSRSSGPGGQNVNKYAYTICSLNWC